MKKLTTFSRLLIAVAFAVAAFFAWRQWGPGLPFLQSAEVGRLDLDTENIDNASDAEKLPLPGTELSSSVAKKPLTTIVGYTWNAQQGLLAANGGPQTTQGSIMEGLGANIKVVRQDELKDIVNAHLVFLDEFANGNPNPKKGAALSLTMGDGAPSFASTLQQAANDKYGAGRYTVQIFGAIGMSYGEDKLIGPQSWRDDPQSMRGALISTVIGDGDWTVSVNYAGANDVPVNPDPTTYDPNAVNFVDAPDMSFIKAAEAYIARRKVPLRLIENGKPGREVQVEITGCATWTPADLRIYEARPDAVCIVSTYEFANQMPCTLIGFKEWAEKTPETVKAILAGSYLAGNQMKKYEEWREAAASCAAETFGTESPEYWQKAFRGYVYADGQNVGGSKVFNLADAKQYYGLGEDKVNRYRSVWEDVSGYLDRLNPCDFKANVKRIIPYDEAVNLSFLRAIKLDKLAEGTASKPNYARSASEVLGAANYNVTFASGSATLTPAGKRTLDEVFNLLVTAEGTKLAVIGHTDNVGNPTSNQTLSEQRAQATVAYLVAKGVSPKRFQDVGGRGDTEPVADNTTKAGQAANRRVMIALLK